EHVSKVKLRSRTHIECGKVEYEVDAFVTLEHCSGVAWLHVSTAFAGCLPSSIATKGNLRIVVVKPEERHSSIWMAGSKTAKQLFVVNSSRENERQVWVVQAYEALRITVAKWLVLHPIPCCENPS